MFLGAILHLGLYQKVQIKVFLYVLDIRYKRPGNRSIAGYISHNDRGF